MAPITVTAAQSGNGAYQGIALTVKIVTGAAAAAGASAGSATITTPRLAVTPTVTGSWVYGALFNGGSSTVFTPDAGTTFTANITDAVNGCCYGSFRTTTTCTSGSPVTVGASAPTGAAGTIAVALCEIIPDAGQSLAEVAGPATVSSTAATTISTAGFSPPDGSVLVAIVVSDANGLVNDVMTMGVSDSGGLTWTRQATGSITVGAGTFQCATVWTAVLPPASPVSVVQAVKVTGNGSHPATLSGTFPAPTTAGNCVVICVCCYASTGTTYSVSACKLGTTSLTQLVFKQAPAGGGNPFTAIWALPGCPGGKTSFTATVAGGNAGFGTGQAVTAYEVSGLAMTIAGLLDKSSAAASLTGTAISSGTTPATASPGDIIVGVLGSWAAVSGVSGSFTNAGTTYVSAGYAIPGATGTFSYGATGSSSHPWAAAVVALAPPAITVVIPDTVTVSSLIPASTVTAWPITQTVVAATGTMFPAPAVSPALIFHVGDSAAYSGNDYAPVVAYGNGVTPTSIAGNTLVAFITIFNTGNLPSFLDGVFDDAANTWTVAAGGGSYNAATGQYGYTAIACCVNARPMVDITVYPDDMSAIASASVQISEFAGLPAGSTIAAVAADSPGTSTASYTTPPVTVPDGTWLILSAVASSSTWASVIPGTPVNGMQAAWNAVSAAGSYSGIYAGGTQTVYGAVTVALGFAAPTAPAAFTPAGVWMGSRSAPLESSNQAPGNLMIVKVTNTSDSTVYCTGLTSSGITWEPAGTPFFGTVNAMTAAAFAGTVITAGPDTIVPTWSGGTPASWTMAGHEFIARAGWRFDAQGGLDSTGTSAWPSLTPSAPGGLYFGHATRGGASAGSTPGYVYNIDVGGSGSSAAYNPETS